MAEVEIERWECPGCGWSAETADDDECFCDYSGGLVQAWYVPKERAVRAEQALTDARDMICRLAVTEHQHGSGGSIAMAERYFEKVRVSADPGSPAASADPASATPEKTERVGGV